MKFNFSAQKFALALPVGLYPLIHQLKTKTYLKTYFILDSYVFSILIFFFLALIVFLHRKSQNIPAYKLSLGGKAILLFFFLSLIQTIQYEEYNRFVLNRIFLDIILNGALVTGLFFLIISRVFSYKDFQILLYTIVGCMTVILLYQFFDNIFLRGGLLSLKPLLTYGVIAAGPGSDTLSAGFIESPAAMIFFIFSLPILLSHLNKQGKLLKPLSMAFSLLCLLMIIFTQNRASIFALILVALFWISRTKMGLARKLAGFAFLFIAFFILSHYTGVFDKFALIPKVGNLVQPKGSSKIPKHPYEIYFSGKVFHVYGGSAAHRLSTLPAAFSNLDRILYPIGPGDNPAIEMRRYTNHYAAAYKYNPFINGGWTGFLITYGIGGIFLFLAFIFYYYRFRKTFSKTRNMDFLGLELSVLLGIIVSYALVFPPFSILSVLTDNHVYYSTGFGWILSIAAAYYESSLQYLKHSLTMP